MTTSNFYFRLVLPALFATGGLLTACSSDDDSTVEGASQSPEAPIRIEVEVNEEPMTDASAEGRETRGTVITTETLQGFNMEGVFSKSNGGYDKQSYTVSKTNSWTVNPNTWPKNDTQYFNPVDFYAYNGGTFNLNNGDAYVSFEVNQNVSAQQDLLVAKRMQMPRPTDGVGKVSLHFSHACAAVAFKVQITNTLKTKLGGESSTLAVNGITLHNVYYKGKYFYNSGWTNINSDKTDFTLTNGAIDVDTDFQDLSSNDLFMIPQNRGDNDDMYLKISYPDNKSVDIPISVNWQAGYKYTVNIRLGTQQIPT